MEEQFVINLSSFNNSAYGVPVEFDYASALQYVSGLPKILFWLMLVSFLLFFIRLLLVKFGWSENPDHIKSTIVIFFDMTSFVILGIALLFGWLLVFRPTPELIKICVNVGYFLVIIGFGWFGYSLYRDMR